MSLHYLRKILISALSLTGSLMILSLSGLEAAESDKHSGKHEPSKSSEPASSSNKGSKYQNDPAHIAAGKRLYMENNCVGCHFRGGGGIGPPFLDDDWHHGGKIEQIYSSIHNGLPDGMPAWKGRLKEEQIWQLAAYVKAFETDAPMPDGPTEPVKRSAGGLDADPSKSRKAKH
ncbi:cytochrome c [Methylophaga sp.]|jgi:mono/diheme cytochrome c family protein|uniref:c-type cytochrome n=1 Tax=Methylophaga sp. TaxID=2024840 RepID=UPI0025E0F54F|nr:cytochrome c [Methylophaga sp.]MDX1751235.1 cytochrome c [Methylophaga sp.]|tara:strand:+ start:3042 stop:3563 length:522 start_codon:yes stop_codon:yes gene_type:complete